MKVKKHRAFVVLGILLAASLTARAQNSPFRCVPGSAPSAVVIADFNGDGKRDFIVANLGSNNLSLFIGNGNGTFQSAVNHTVDEGPNSLAVGDFNGDGKADLAVGYFEARNISVLLGLGNGTFQSAINYAIGGAVASISVGDFNGDGKPDLGLAKYGSDHNNDFGSVSVLINNGNGTFHNEANTGVNRGPTGAAGDFNSDGKLDLVVVNSGDHNLMLLLGSGNGTFQNGSYIPTDTLFPQAVAAGDFNGDGKADLALATFFSAPGVSVLLGNGDGTFQTPSNIASPNPLASLTAGDLNGDGRLDLIGNGYPFNDLNNLTVFLGNGNGTLQTGANYATGKSPAAAVIGDFNGDSAPDLAVPNTGGNTASVLLNNGNGTFKGPVSFESGTIPYVVSYPVRSLSGPGHMTSADFNGDGKPDLVIGMADGISVLINNGDGTFKGAISYVLNGGSPVVADFNNDGRLDIATPALDNTTSTNGVTVLLGNGDGTFQNPRHSSAGFNLRSLAAGDFNNDGKTDVAAADYYDGGNIGGTVLVLHGNGNGTFQAGASYHVGSGFTYSIAAADFNGDGKPDLAVIALDASQVDPYVAVLFGNGGGTFQNPVNYLLNNSYGDTIATGDLNGDGKPDLATAGNGINVLINNGDGTFRPANFYFFGGGNIVLADFNVDGKLDLVSGSAILLNNGNGTFQRPVDYGAGILGGDSAVADLDGNGKLDLVLGEGCPTGPNIATSSVRVFLNLGSPAPILRTVQLSAFNYDAPEDGKSILITVTRPVTSLGVVTVDYETSGGSAAQRTDYTLASGTLTFAPGDTSKTFRVQIADDVYVEAIEQFNVSLSNPNGGVSLASPTVATVTIIDNDASTPTTNPMDDAQLFVRQHYSDFLSRSPDQSGFDYWTGQITQCGSNQSCLLTKRVDVSNAFFYEQEFQETGAFVYRVYKAAFGQRPTYQQFMPDRARVIGGAALEQSKTNFTNAFVLRQAFSFTSQGPGPGILPFPQYVDLLNTNTGNSLTQSQRDALVTALINGTETRASVLRKVADLPAFIDHEYHASFVLTQYFGYLRRNPDQGGYDFWLEQMNRFPIRDVGAQHTMVCAFITSAEYQQRFSPIVTHSNGDCPH